jgi:hypothetical protein
MVTKKNVRSRAKMTFVTDTGETYLIRMTPECIKVRKHYARKVLDVSFRDLVDLANGVDSVPVLIRLPRQTKVTA